jgi:uncharacterized membrane protein
MLAPSSHRFRAEDTLAHRIAVAFILYGLLATAFLAINVPPFQNPDEPMHFMRASQIADGRLISGRFTRTEADGSRRLLSGGPVDPAIWAAFAPFNPLIFHPETKASRADWAPGVHWSAERSDGDIQFMASYPPLFYAPSVVGILAGRYAGATIVQTLTLSRLLTGATAVAVGAVAIATAGAAGLWIFAILTLPMSLWLIASCSQDALTLAFAALAASMLVRLLRWPREQNPSALVWLGIAIALVGIARPPYGALSLLPLVLTRISWRTRILTASACAASVVAWSAISQATTLTNVGAIVGADPARQIELLRADPLMVVQLMINTIRLQWPGYLITFIGQLGWLDTALPHWYHRVACWMLVIAATGTALSMSQGEGVSLRARLVIGSSLLIAALGVVGLQYLTWTPPGQMVIDGVQGRYFLPLALPIAALLPALGDTRLSWPRHALTLAVVTFPIVSIAVVMRQVVLRYYLG